MAHLNSFNTQFSEQTQLNLTDSHLLVSTLIRPESSNFSRVQRLSCLFVFLLLSMISHAMYFKENPDVSPSQVKIGSLSFSLKDLYVSFIVVLITTPPILCASFLFKKTAKTSYNFKHVFSRRASTSSQKYTETRTTPIDLKCMFDTEKTLFPRWVLFIAWVVLFLAALASAFFLLWYSLNWGKEKSTKWLINFSLSSLESIFIVDPAKVNMASDQRSYFTIQI
jgi:polycystin 1L2